MHALLKPKSESPTAIPATVELVARKPKLRVLVRFANGGHYRQVDQFNLRTLPPGSRRLTDDELRAIPWDGKFGPDPLSTPQSTLFPQPEVRP
jgi:hypothetical protein